MIAVPQPLIDDVERTIIDLRERPNVYSLSPDDLRRCAQEFGRPTVFGSTNWASTVKNRSASLTINLGSHRVPPDLSTAKKRDITKHAPETVRALHEYLKKIPLLKVDCRMGDNDVFSPECTLYISTYRRESVRIAHQVAQTLFPSNRQGGKRLTTVYIPEWQERDRQILVFPEIGVTYVLGTDYYGEAKNAFLRMAMWSAKQEGLLGLHAGTKIIRATRPDGHIRRLGMLLFGMSASGKTTHICSDHGLDLPDEGVEVSQDDVVFWTENAAALGSERGFYIKTEGLDLGVHPALHHAAASSNSLLDNVVVDYEGNVYFEDRTLTANGRAIIQKDDLGELSAPTIDLPPLDDLDGLIIAFTVRKYTVIPIASRLTPEQAAVAFLLSESFDSSGPDARDIGGSPLLVAEPADEANAFYELVKANQDKIQCYMLNTGGVGELVELGLDGARRVKKKVTRVEIDEMAAIIRGIARGTIKWSEDPDWMVETPEYVKDLDLDKFDLRKHYSQARIDYLVAATRLERAEYIETIPGLKPEIKKSVEF